MVEKTISSVDIVFLRPDSIVATGKGCVQPGFNSYLAKIVKIYLNLSISAHLRLANIVYLFSPDKEILLRI